jgi:hypothetical protein
VEFYKLIIFLHAKRYLPSSMRSHLQNSHAPHKRRTGCREAGNRELNPIKILPALSPAADFGSQI